ncbi:MAG: hypothetical protein C4297_11825 [Gemmataceae bacterium]
MSRTVPVLLSLGVMLVATPTLWDGASGARQGVFLRPVADSGSAPEEADLPVRASAVDMPPADALEAAIRRGVAFLLQDQNKDGSWGGPQLRGGVMIYAPVPGAHDAFRAAVTALCISALIESGGDTPEVKQAIRRAETWLLEHLPRVRRATPDAIYNVWTHAYGIQALVRLYRLRSADDPQRHKIAELIRHQYGMLERYESVDGGWGYYDFRAGTQRPASDSTSFTTAAVLVALYEAKQIGLSPPERLVRRAVDSIIRQRKSDFSYLYGEYLKYRPMDPINRPAGSLGRSQACNIALRLWGDDKISDRVLTIWLHRLFARNGWLSVARKTTIPHESFFAIAGYFFYFGHYYAALCIEQLPPAERPFFQAHLTQLLIKLQEKDGSWWDYPFYNYHQQYGTAFALMALQRCKSKGTGKN